MLFREIKKKNAKLLETEKELEKKENQICELKQKCRNLRNGQ